MSGLAGYISYIDDELTDAGVKKYWLTSTIWPFLALACSYLLFVKVLGPAFMKHRQPFELRTALILYNVLQIVVNTFVFYEAILLAIHPDFNFRCMPMLHDDRTEYGEQIYRTSLHYISLKFLDFGDTIFMVLRKKQKQVSFLHTFHHISAAFVGWTIVKFFPSGHTVGFGLFNAPVHSVMYAYYLLTILRPAQTNSYTWKKHITLLQIVQLAILFLREFQTLFYNPCNYSGTLAKFVMAEMGFLIVLFINFYIRTYVITNKTTAQNHQSAIKSKKPKKT